MHHIHAQPMRHFVGQIFAAAGCHADEAARVARYLVEANLTGHDSHGVIRVPRYINWLKTGRVVPNQTIQVVSENDVLAVIDGRYGFGQSVGEQAVSRGIDKARANGVSIVALRNSGHLGRIGDWAELAAAHDLISVHFVNTTGLGMLVAPFGTAERRFSTNPFAVGVPVKGRWPLILDFATSIVAEGKILVAVNGGKPLPEGALIDGQGHPTNNPEAVYGKLTSTQPLDSRSGTGAIRAMGEHKGSGLSFMCEILAGALTGGGCARKNETQLVNGMLSIFMAVDRFDSGDYYAAEVERYVAFVKSARAIEVGGEVLLPGEPEQRNRETRAKHGLPLTAATWDSIVATASELDIAQAQIPAAAE